MSDPRGFWRTTGIRRIVIGAAVFVAIPAAAYLVGRRASTLEESVLNATPPAAREITAAVEEKVLGSVEVFRGTLVRPDVPLTASFEDPVVLMAISPQAGEELTEGTVVAVVDDRPLFVLGGTLPLIHSLGPGDTGTMVAQLQQALARLGLYQAEVDGRYGPHTGRAVRDLFENAGFPAPEGISEASVLFVPNLPAPVVSVEGHIGDVLEGEVDLMTLSTGNPVVEVNFGPDDAGIFQMGISATLREVQTDRRFELTLKEIVDAGSEEAPGRKIARFRPLDDVSGVDPNDLTVEIDLRPSDRPSLVVPSTGLYADAGGTTYVLKETPEGTERITVEILFAADGEAAVNPEGPLEAGDRVVVGMVEGG